MRRAGTSAVANVRVVLAEPDAVEVGDRLLHDDAIEGRGHVADGLPPQVPAASNWWSSER